MGFVLVVGVVAFCFIYCPQLPIQLKHFFFLDFSFFQKFFPIVFYIMKYFNQLVFGDFSTAN